MLIDRQAELDFFHTILTRQHPGPAQLILLYGRRRVGKTFLLRHWAENSGVRYIYWAAEKESAALQRRRLFAKVLGVEPSQATSFDSWSDCWQAIARVLEDRRVILLLDEFSYAVEAEPGMLSSLQHAWDQLFQNSQLVIVLCGSHVHAMESLLTHQSPLFGRFTGQWWLRPLAYAHLQEYFPHWTIEERIAAYAIVGGIPAYWTWLDPRKRFLDNVRKMLTPGSPFIGEPNTLLYDEVREPTSYLSIIRALGAGYHTLAELSNATMISRGNLSAYLARLQDLHLVERRVSIVIPPAQRDRSRTGRYRLLDPFFRFYFRFVPAYQEELDYHLDDVMAKVIKEVRSFIGATGFEELCRRWVMEQSRAHKLPCIVQEVGSHWSRAVQVDVVGMNWEDHHILLGECKWGKDPVEEEVITDLVQRKTSEVFKHLPNLGDKWQAHHILFARARLKPAAQAAAATHGVELVDLAALDAVLSH